MLPFRFLPFQKILPKNLAAFLLIPGLLGAASAPDHWVATWATSPMGARAAAPRPAGAAPVTAPPAARGPAPANAGGPPPNPAPQAFNDETIRMVVHTTIGGKRARVQLSNAFGTAPLNIGAAHIALRDKESAITAGSDHPLSFSGKTSFTIPAGADIVSDPLDIEVPKLGDLVVSLYLPGTVNSVTSHQTGLHSTYIVKGNQSDAPYLTEPRKAFVWYFLSAVDVLAPADTGVIVAYGDSITDGATSTPDTDSSWPSQLAVRLAANKATANLAIVNEGISGNRVLADGAGVSALTRLDRDVLSQPGVQWLVFMEGINDIGIAARPVGGAPALTADDLITAHRQIIERAHIRGIKVIGATLTPYQGASYYSEEGEAIRMALNNWIRTSGQYDAVFDFDKAVQDPANPKQILAMYNIRDHLHPNDVGYKAMADSVDLSIFGGKKKK